MKKSYESILKNTLTYRVDVIKIIKDIENRLKNLENTNTSEEEEGANTGSNSKKEVSLSVTSKSIPTLPNSIYTFSVESTDETFVPSYVHLVGTIGDTEVNFETDKYGQYILQFMLDNGTNQESNDTGHGQMLIPERTTLDFELNVNETDLFKSTSLSVTAEIGGGGIYERVPL